MKFANSMPHIRPPLCGRHIAFGVLIGCLLPLGAQADQDPQSVLTLYYTVDNNTELSCSTDVPRAGSDTTVKFYPKDPGACERNEGAEEEEDKIFKPHSIRIRNAPAATTFVLSDKTATQDRNCSKESDSNWIELETTRPNSSLEKLGIDKLTDYRGYITNAGSDSNARSIGVKMVASKGSIVRGNLSCIEITTSAGAATRSK
ncbi:hypothetical protein [Pseudomonas putida]|uniref:Lipoprotein n=1 Tax=Pseudomonas putida TaxID=303 RepID=A0A7V8J0S6_PSEPU|nr:hypothetical protein [Pseudomonas putida]KAF0250834.1 hypothetical protein GN299_31810 [Pseudomonas putida]